MNMLKLFNNRDKRNSAMYMLMDSLDKCKTPYHFDIDSHKVKFAEYEVTFELLVNKRSLKNIVFDYIVYDLD